MSTRGVSRLHAFVVLLAVTALAAGAFSWSRVPPIVNVAALTMTALAVAAEEMYVPLSGGVSLSVSSPLLIAVLMLFGPTTGAITAAICGAGGLISDWNKREKALLKGVFNAGQMVLSALSAGLLFYVLSGSRNLPGDAVFLRFPLVLLTAVLVSAVFFAVNATLVALVVSLDQGAPFLTIWSSGLFSMLPTNMALAVVGLALAEVVASVGYGGLIFFVIPLLVSREIYQQYVRLRETYADTVRSLISSIEAKDTYTRGHSERVAIYAEALARRLGLPQPEVERITLAALLHDLGKLGVSESILLKASALSGSEFEQIRKHPAAGAHIIESVPFLENVLPAVRFHHERFDGGGYGTGLRGPAIPEEARILAVADSFDAMTSTRPYRAALSIEKALEELQANSGTQFDPDVVAAFQELAREGEIQLQPDSIPEEASDVVA